MPLGKLQRPAGYTATGAHDYPRFLYDDSAFHEGVTGGQLRQRPLAVVLQPRVPDWLVSLSGLLRPLLELHWTRAVAARNGKELGEDDLRAFLFGSERRSLLPLRPGLFEAQYGRCFCCGQPLPAHGVEIDHFVPVVTPAERRTRQPGPRRLAVQQQQAGLLRRLPLLRRWSTRSTTVLEQVADQVARPLRVVESQQAARGLYAHLPFGAPLWQAPGVFPLLDRAELPDLLLEVGQA